MTGTAQNKLGELFVDIGVGGLGTTLKALNSVSASFLLTKNAAMQVIKPIVDVGLKTASSAVGIGKMASALATSSLNAQKLQYYLNKYQANGLEGDIANLQQTFTRAHEGLGGFSDAMTTTFNELGIEWENYNGSFEDTLKLIEDVKQKIKTMNAPESVKMMHLQNLGLQNWRYLFEKEDFNINESLNISDETILNLQKADEEVNDLKNTIDETKKILTDKALKHGVMEGLKDINKATKGDKKAMLKTGIRTTSIIGGGLAGMAVGSFIPIPVVGTLGGFLIGSAGAYFGNEKIMQHVDSQEGRKKLKEIPFYGKYVKYSPETSAAIPEAMNGLPPLPITATQDISTVIYNQNNITGSNAEEIAGKLTEINANDINTRIQSNSFMLQSDTGK